MPRRSYLQNLADPVIPGRAIVSPSPRAWPDDVRPPAVLDTTAAQPLVSSGSPRRAMPAAPSPLPAPSLPPPLATSMPSVPETLSEQPPKHEMPVLGWAVPPPVSPRWPEPVDPLPAAVPPPPQGANVAPSPREPAAAVQRKEASPDAAPRTLPPAPAAAFASPIAPPAPSELPGFHGQRAIAATTIAERVAAPERPPPLREPRAKEEPPPLVEAAPARADALEPPSRALPQPDFDVPPPRQVEPTSPERAGPTVHIGVIEVRSPLPAAPPRIIREVAAPAQTLRATPLVRGLAWRYGLVQS